VFSKGRIGLISSDAAGRMETSSAKGRVMKKVRKPKSKPDMLDEYDFGKGVRGKYAKRYTSTKGNKMKRTFPAVIQQSEKWWIGWVEEIPGVNAQGKTREELLENLQSALQEALEMNRADARAAMSGPYEEVSIVG
jgi:predicted RNase H-like HicB family nuclease